MISSTVLRVKRRVDEAPHEALLLHCKRLKTDKGFSEPVEPSLFIFSGTINNKDNSPDLETIRSSVKDSLESNKLNKISLIVEKLRHEQIKQSQTNRFEVLNFNRGIGINPEENLNKDHHVLDIEQKYINEPDTVDTTCGYAYDLYLARKKSKDEYVTLEEFDSIVRIDSLNADLIYNSINQEKQDINSSEDSEDSNDENNYRNDYPDTPDVSISEDDMIAAMGNVNIGDDLSSDDGEDLLIYDDKLTADELKPDKDDVDRYGSAYASYKARIVAERTAELNSSNFVHFDAANEDPRYSRGHGDVESDDEFYYAKDDDADCELFANSRSGDDSD